MKKLVIFVFMLVCLFCNSVMCFAYSKITTEYDEKDNKIVHTYEQTYRLGTSEKVTNVLAMFNYDKRYEFNEDFDSTTQLCKPSDMIFVFIVDYANRLKYIKDEIVLIELGTGKRMIVPITLKKTHYRDDNSDAVSFALWPDDNPEFINMVLADKPFKLGFNFSVEPARGIAENLDFDFDREELDKLKSVIDYDLYSDLSQTENIRKAVAAISAN